MTPSTWKKVELRVARLYGATRISLSGSNNQQGGTSSDTDHPRLYVEIKHGKRLLPFGGLWKATRANAKAEGKVPVIVLHPLRGEALAVISAERHAALERLAARAREHAAEDCPDGGPAEALEDLP
ncbi:MAG TPA: hypothetical protein VGR28_11770 [Candidatus Thermoplasmatota archaeon]|jgi:hypothetical protein|nr:hypothetical protein [Candidatus Thermoplasmatota archaeon]